MSESEKKSENPEPHIAGWRARQMRRMKSTSDLVGRKRIENDGMSLFHQDDDVYEDDEEIEGEKTVLDQEYIGELNINKGNESQDISDSRPHAIERKRPSSSSNEDEGDVNKGIHIVIPTANAPLETMSSVLTVSGRTRRKHSADEVKLTRKQAAKSMKNEKIRKMNLISQSLRIPLKSFKNVKVKKKTLFSFKKKKKLKKPEILKGEDKKWDKIWANTDNPELLNTRATFGEYSLRPKMMRAKTSANLVGLSTLHDEESDEEDEEEGEKIPKESIRVENDKNWKNFDLHEYTKERRKNKKKKKKKKAREAKLLADKDREITKFKKSAHSKEQSLHREIRKLQKRGWERERTITDLREEIRKQGSAKQEAFGYKMKRKENEIKVLKKQIKMMKEENTRQRISELETAVKVLRAKYDEKQQLVSVLMKEAKSLRKQKSGLQIQLDQQREYNKDLFSKRREIAMQLTRLESINKKLTSENGRLKEKNEEFSDKIDALSERKTTIIYNTKIDYGSLKLKPDEEKNIRRKLRKFKKKKKKDDLDEEEIIDVEAMEEKLFKAMKKNSFLKNIIKGLKKENGELKRKNVERSSHGPRLKTKGKNPNFDKILLKAKKLEEEMKEMKDKLSEVNIKNRILEEEKNSSEEDYLIDEERHKKQVQNLKKMLEEIINLEPLDGKSVDEQVGILLGEVRKMRNGKLKLINELDESNTKIDYMKKVEKHLREENGIIQDLYSLSLSSIQKAHEKTI